MGKRLRINAASRLNAAINSQWAAQAKKVAQLVAGVDTKVTAYSNNEDSITFSFVDRERPAGEVVSISPKIAQELSVKLAALGKDSTLTVATYKGLVLVSINSGGSE